MEALEARVHKINFTQEGEGRLLQTTSGTQYHLFVTDILSGPNSGINALMQIRKGDFVHDFFLNEKQTHEYKGQHFELLSSIASLKQVSIYLEQGVHECSPATRNADYLIDQEFQGVPSNLRPDEGISYQFENGEKSEFRYIEHLASRRHKGNYKFEVTENNQTFPVILTRYRPKEFQQGLQLCIGDRHGGGIRCPLLIKKKSKKERYEILR